MKVIVQEYGKAVVTAVVAISIFAILFAVSYRGQTGLYAVLSEGISEEDVVYDVVSSFGGEIALDDDTTVILRAMPKVGRAILCADLLEVCEDETPVDFHIVSVKRTQDPYEEIAEEVATFDEESITFHRRGSYRMTIELYGKVRCLKDVKLVVI